MCQLLWKDQAPEIPFPHQWLLLIALLRGYRRIVEALRVAQLEVAV